MDATIHSFEQFFNALGNPEYGFLYLEPVLIWGILFGLVTFIFAMLVKEQKTQFFGLIIIAVSCLAITPYCNKRASAEKRIVTVYQADSQGRASGFSAGTEERRGMRWLYYTTAVIATGTVLVGAGRSLLGLTFSGVTLLAAAGTIFFGSLAHYREARIFHPNLRQSDPPPSASVAGRLTPVDR